MKIMYVLYIMEVAAVFMAPFLIESVLPLSEQPLAVVVVGVGVIAVVVVVVIVVIVFFAVPNLCSKILTNIEWKLSTSLKPTKSILVHKSI